MQQQEEMIVDETTGLVQKVETVTFAAHDEYGNVIVRQQKRAVAARLLVNFTLNSLLFDNCKHQFNVL